MPELTKRKQILPNGITIFWEESEVRRSARIVPIKYASASLYVTAGRNIDNGAWELPVVMWGCWTGDQKALALFQAGAAETAKVASSLEEWVREQNAKLSLVTEQAGPAVTTPEPASNVTREEPWSGDITKSPPGKLSQWDNEAPTVTVAVEPKPAIPQIPASALSSLVRKSRLKP